MQNKLNFVPTHLFTKPWSLVKVCSSQQRKWLLCKKKLLHQKSLTGSQLIDRSTFTRVSANGKPREKRRGHRDWIARYREVLTLWVVSLVPPTWCDYNEVSNRKEFSRVKKTKSLFSSFSSTIHSWQEIEFNVM